MRTHVGSEWLEDRHLLNIRAVKFYDGETQVCISIGRVQHEGALERRLGRTNVPELELTGSNPHSHLGGTPWVFMQGSSVPDEM